MTADRRIASVRRLPQEGPYVIEVQWMGGRVTRADLASQLLEFKIYEPVRDPEVFKRLEVGDDGWVLEWPGGSEISSDTIVRLAEEFAVDTTMSPDQFRAWRTQENLTLEQAARALGLSRRTIAYYESGGVRIPRVVALATLALSARHIQFVGEKAAYLTSGQSPTRVAQPSAIGSRYGVSFVGMGNLAGPVSHAIFTALAAAPGGGQLMDLAEALGNTASGKVRSEAVPTAASATQAVPENSQFLAHGPSALDLAELIPVYALRLGRDRSAMDQHETN